MNEKTTKQIEEMKTQTIGVEVEMNSITREKAAKLAADFFGTGRYKYTARRNGYEHGAHGMRTAENGNSKRMSVLQDRTAKNANW